MSQAEFLDFLDEYWELCQDDDPRAAIVVTVAML
jgi:hypothetical protein